MLVSNTMDLVSAFIINKGVIIVWTMDTNQQSGPHSGIVTLMITKASCALKFCSMKYVQIDWLTKRNQLMIYNLILFFCFRSIAFAARSFQIMWYVFHQSNIFVSSDSIFSLFLSLVFLLKINCVRKPRKIDDCFKAPNFFIFRINVGRLMDTDRLKQTLVCWP